MSRGTAEQLRADTKALIKHVLANSRREHIPPQELRELATLWEASWHVPEGTDDCEVWVAFRLAYSRVMGDEVAPLSMHTWPS